MLVLDASATMPWCYEDEATPFSEALLDWVRVGGAIVPVVWPLEVVNSLLIGERRTRLNAARISLFVATVRALPITIDEQGLVSVWDKALSLGREHGLSAYDATYLELAIREDLPLASLDARLRLAATRSGVALVEHP